MKIAQIVINRTLLTKPVVYTYNKIPLSSKKESNLLIHKITWKNLKNYAELKKPDTKHYILYRTPFT